MVDFAELVEAESRGLQAAVTAIVGDRDRAEELVQDAFERCYRRWRSVSRMDRPGAWVRRVAMNAAISSRRRSTVEARTLARLGTSEGASAATHDPLDALDDHEIWSIVRTLPQQQAAAIALRYGADLGLDEIAETLDISVSATKSLLHRGRTALRSSDALRSHTT